MKSIEDVLKAQGIEEAKIKAAVLELEKLRSDLVNRLMKADEELETKNKMVSDLSVQLTDAQGQIAKLEKELATARSAPTPVVVTGQKWSWRRPWVVVGVRPGLFWAATTASLIIGGFLMWSIFDHTGRERVRADAAEAALAKATASEEMGGLKFLNGMSGDIQWTCGSERPHIYITEYPIGTPKKYWSVGCKRDFPADLPVMTGRGKFVLAQQ